MKLRRKSDLIANVANAWKEQYRSAKHSWRGDRSEAIYEKLLDLPKHATDNDVTKIIGNRSWTQNKCNECGKDVDLTVHLGEEPDYEVVYFYVCASCIKEALELIDAEEEGQDGMDQRQG